MTTLFVGFAVSTEDQLSTICATIQKGYFAFILLKKMAIRALVSAAQAICHFTVAKTSDCTLVKTIEINAPELLGKGLGVRFRRTAGWLEVLRCSKLAQSGPSCDVGYEALDHAITRRR